MLRKLQKLHGSFPSQRVFRVLHAAQALEARCLGSSERVSHFSRNWLGLLRTKTCGEQHPLLLGIFD